MMKRDKAILAVIIAATIVVVISVFNVNKEYIRIENAKPLAIQSWKSDGGAKVMYVHAPQLPMVDIRLVFDAGSARDNGKPGVAMVTNSMLDLGAGQWTTDEIAERFDSVGTQFGNDSMRDMAILSLRSLTEKVLLDKSIETLNAILTQPKFENDELERTRKQVLISLRNQQQSPGTIAGKTLYKTLYKGHPYATPIMGTTESIRQITRDDLLSFYKKYYVSKNAVIAIVGDINREQAEELVEKIFKGLPKGKHAESISTPEPLKEAVNVHIEHPSTQTHILIGQPGMKRGDKDYLALYVGNHILGGSGFGSRIVEEIREKRGLAYSSYSYFTPMRVEGPFIMGLQTANNNSDEALKIIKQVLREFIDKGPTEKELLHAKKNITGGFALKVDSNKDIIGYLGMIGFYDLPLSYLRTFNDHVEAITIEQIKDAFKRRVDPDKMAVITVGARQ
ncbi:MAG: pitrilysin family protein [Gammaproteobacteria bacterium]